MQGRDASLAAVDRHPCEKERHCRRCGHTERVEDQLWADWQIDPQRHSHSCKRCQKVDSALHEFQTYEGTHTSAPIALVKECRVCGYRQP